MNANIKQHDLGNRGGEVISDTSETTGDWYMITSTSDSTAFTTLTGNITSKPTLLKSGVSIYGQFSTITLSAGEVIAYNR
tara:strand:- start:3020 stop:3259 length:240 start_codon:yes stop_codon:yes gene_type:complete